jgi:Tfp pilus assembly protein PilF
VSGPAAQHQVFSYASLLSEHLWIRRLILSYVNLLPLLGGVALCLGSLSLPAADQTQQELTRAEGFARQGQLDAAEKEYLKIIRRDPKSYVAHNDLGAVYMSQKQYSSACREFLQAASLNPRVAGIQQNLGMCLFQSHRIPQAVKALEKAKALDAQNLKTRYLLGYSFLLLNHLDAAVKELEYVRAHKPGDENALFSLVRLYRDKKDDANAEAAFNELVRYHPDSVFAHILMGESYDVQAKPQKAIEEFRTAVSMAPRMPRLHFDLGFLLWAENRFNEAEHELRRELQVTPGFAPALYYLGEIALSRNRYSEAENLFMQTIANNSNCAAAYIGLGTTYARSGLYQNALAQFKRATRLDPSQPSAHYWLATTYRHLKDDDDSKAEMRKYESLAKSDALATGNSPGVRTMSRQCMEKAP